MYPTYQISGGFVHTLIALAFYLVMLGLIIYSLLAVYSLLRYGRNKILVLVVSILYFVIISSLYASAIHNLNQLKF